LAAGQDVDRAARSGVVAGSTCALRKRHAVVLEDVAEPHDRVSAGEDAGAALDPAAPNDPAFGQRVGEAEARQHHGIDLVESGVVAEAIAVEEDRIELRPAAADPVEASTAYDL